VGKHSRGTDPGSPSGTTTVATLDAVRPTDAARSDAVHAGAGLLSARPPTSALPVRPASRWPGALSATPPVPILPVLPVLPVLPALTLPAPAPVVRAPLPPVPAYRGEAPASAPAPALVAPSGHAARTRRARRARTGRRLALGLVVVVVAGGAVVATGLAMRQPTASAPRPVLAAGRTQSTVLFALADPRGDEAALLAGDPVARTASVTLLPSRTVTSVTGRGQLPLGKAVAQTDPAAATAAVSDLLGLTVDGAWRLTPDALAALVDGVGGVPVTVDRDITVGGAVVLHAGPGQRLMGSAAVTFAQALDPAEDESARLARLQAVLDGVLTALPADPPALAARVSALGGGSESTLAPPRLAQVLAQLVAVRARPGVPIFSILPVTTLSSGGDAVTYRVDERAFDSYVAATLAASVPPGARAGAVRVFVYSGTLEHGVGAAARQRLVDAGLVFVGSKNETQPGRATSVVLVPDATDPSRREGSRVAKALGLPVTAVQVAATAQDAADVVVLVGADFTVG